MAASRITAACAIVTASAASPKHKEISKRQKKALLAVIKKEALPVEKIPDMVSELSEATWCAQDLQDVIDALQDTINVGEQSDDLNDRESPLKEKEPMRQECTTLVHFLTQSQWDSVMVKDPDHPIADVHLTLADIMHQLGLRNPSEYTSRTFTVVALCCEEGIDAVSCKTSSELKTMYTFLKNELKHELKKKSKSDHEMSHDALKLLPTTPAILQKQFPECYSRLYARELPVVCPFSVMKLKQIEFKFKTRKHIELTKPPVPTVLQPDINSSTMAAFGNMMVTSMKEMAQVQKQLVVQMMGSGKPLTIKALPKPQALTMGRLVDKVEDNTSLPLLQVA